jgi:AcrR family transcriptional regulator
VIVDEEPGQDVGRERANFRSSDPRALRTRQKLVEAFHAAVVDADPAAMSVASLTRAAGVNRTSFYSHFASPEDLAIHALSDLLDVVRDADILMRSEHSVPAAEASRRALRDIVWFVWERRDSYALVLGPGAAPRLKHAVAGAFTERTEASLWHVEGRPRGTDVRVTARFLAGGLLGAIGDWLGDGRSAMSPDDLVQALTQCLPGWLNTD